MVNTSVAAAPPSRNGDMFRPAEFFCICSVISSASDNFGSSFFPETPSFRFKSARLRPLFAVFSPSDCERCRTCSRN